MTRREERRGRGVDDGDDGGNPYGGKQPRSRGARGRAPDYEHTRAEHRTHADADRADKSESPHRRRVGAHA